MLSDLMEANPLTAGLLLTAAPVHRRMGAPVRALKPERLLIVDAADIGLNPGEIRIIDPMISRHVYHEHA